MEPVGLGSEGGVRDLWTHADLGKSKEQLAKEGPAHSVVLLRVSR
jgi:Alpha galactosidase C-terminal beta sandwich domain